MKKIFFYSMVNLLIFYFFISIIIIGPFIAINLKRIFYTTDNSPMTRDSFLEHYATMPSIAGPLAESQFLQMQYFDYYVWRRREFRGNYINIDKNGIRISADPISIDSENFQLGGGRFYFLGGSTVFGYGANDYSTIPSHFARFSGAPTTNLGETGYTARQSLAFLVSAQISSQVLDGPSIIISYDGANDVGHGCRNIIGAAETGYQSLIRRSLMDYQNKDVYSVGYLFQPVINILSEIFSVESFNELNQDAYDCSSNDEKARLVARNVIESWQAMSDIAEANGALFLAILQPLAYFDDTPIKSPFVAVDNVIRDEINAVYPIIVEMASGRNFNFLDLSSGLDDGGSEFFFDFCHLSGDGNKIISEKIWDHISKLI